MYEYYEDIYYFPGNISIPWYEYSKTAKKIIVEDGVTSICRFAFLDANRCKELKIGKDVQLINDCAFENTKIPTLIIPKTVEIFGAGLFMYCSNDVYYDGTQEDFSKVVKAREKFDYEIDGLEYCDWNTFFLGDFLYYSETYLDGGWYYENGVPTAYESEE